MNKSTCDSMHSSNYPNQSRSELWEMVQLLNKHQPATIIEIGTSEGGSGVFWNYFCQKNNGYFITIDVDITDKPRGKFSNSITPVVFIEGKSQDQKVILDVRNKLQTKQVDFIYIDGDHTEEAVYQDIKNYIGFLKTGGVMAFHDVKRPTDGAKLAIDRAKEDGLIKFTEEGTFLDDTRIDMGTYYFIKE